MGFDLLKLQPRSNQLILGIGIDAVETRVRHRWRTDAHVHFKGASITESLHQLAAGGAPHDGVIDNDDPLPFQDIRQGVELDSNSRFPHRLGGLNERAAHVAVFDQTITKGDATGLGKTDRRWDTRIGHTDNQISFHR